MLGRLVTDYLERISRSALEKYSPIIKDYVKGKKHKASVRKDGSIYLNKKIYTSPSLAAKSIVGRATNGWVFWEYKKPNNNWVKINELRKKK